MLSVTFPVSHIRSRHHVFQITNSTVLVFSGLAVHRLSRGLCTTASRPRQFPIPKNQVDGEHRYRTLRRLYYNSCRFQRIYRVFKELSPEVNPDSLSPPFLGKKRACRNRRCTERKSRRQNRRLVPPADQRKAARSELPFRFHAPRAAEAPGYEVLPLEGPFHRL
jgi:hypothetical protein